MAHELQYGRSSSTHQFQSLRACVAAAMTAVAWLQLARHPDLLARAGALLSTVHFTNGQQLQVVCSLRLWSSGHDHVPCSRKFPSNACGRMLALQRSLPASYSLCQVLKRLLRTSQAELYRVCRGYLSLQFMVLYTRLQPAMFPMLQGYLVVIRSGTPA